MEKCAINLDEFLWANEEQKEVCNLLATPYLSGWSKFTLTGTVRTDIAVTFIADKPYPTSILKIFAKAKVLAGYK